MQNACYRDLSEDCYHSYLNSGGEESILLVFVFSYHSVELTIHDVSDIS